MPTPEHLLPTFLLFCTLSESTFIKVFAYPDADACSMTLVISRTRICTYLVTPVGTNLDLDALPAKIMPDPYGS